MSFSRTLPEIVKKVVINAPINSVWEKVSTAEGLEKWWMSSTLQAKKNYEFILHTGPFGDSRCIVTEVDPPHLLSFLWDQDWKLTFRLREVGPEATEFTLIHSGWIEGKSSRTGQPYPEVRKIMDEGWDRIVSERLPAQFVI